MPRHSSWRGEHRRLPAGAHFSYVTLVKCVAGGAALHTSDCTIRGGDTVLRRGLRAVPQSAAQMRTVGRIAATACAAPRRFPHVVKERVQMRNWQEARFSQARQMLAGGSVRPLIASQMHRLRKCQQLETRNCRASCFVTGFTARHLLRFKPFPLLPRAEFPPLAFCDTFHSVGTASHSSEGLFASFAFASLAVL